MSRALITGISGFVGSHLADFLLSKKIEVFGTIRWRSRLQNIRHIKDKITLVEADVRDSFSLMKLLKKVKPEYIFHLAAQSFVPTSWTAPAETLETNIIGTINLLEAIRESGCDAKIHIAGSSEEYGYVLPNEVPMDETAPLRPMSPYGVSKVAADLLGFQYHRSYGLKIVRTRAFNHSVSKWSPIIVKDGYSGLVDIKYISELRSREKVGGYLSGEMVGDLQLWNMRRHPLYVWSRTGWAKANELSCHPIRGESLIRVTTKQGILEATNNHSIIGPDLGRVGLGEINREDSVASVDWPTTNRMWIHKDLAWLYGLIVADGCFTNGKIRIDNKDTDLLEKAEKIILKHWGKGSYYTDGQNGVKRLTVRSPHKLSSWLYNHFYASNRDKRVPACILNAQPSAKLAFLKGYNAGDGLKAGHGDYEFKSFKTKSRILASGLIYLIKHTTRQESCLNVESRNGGYEYFSINLNSNIPEHTNWGAHSRGEDGVIKRVERIPYTEEVWDVSTGDGMFNAGIGNLLACNTGPRRGEPFVCSNFAKQIVEIEKKLQPPIIKVGNLTAKRDFTDVRDVVRAYWLTLQKCEYGEVYNICSGETRTIQSILDLLLEKTSISIKVKQDPERLRPSDVLVLQGDYSKFRKQTGWKPEIPFNQTLEDLLNYWRALVEQKQEKKSH